VLLIFIYSVQDTVINHAAEIVANHLNKSTLFVVGTYTIGKERIIVQLASVFGFKVYAQPWKYAFSFLFLPLLLPSFLSSLRDKNVTIIVQLGKRLYILFLLHS
jgi:hypothetical protein